MAAGQSIFEGLGRIAITAAIVVCVTGPAHAQTLITGSSATDAPRAAQADENGVVVYRGPSRTTDAAPTPRVGESASTTIDATPSVALTTGPTPQASTTKGTATLDEREITRVRTVVRVGNCQRRRRLVTHGVFGVRRYARARGRYAKDTFGYNDQTYKTRLC